MSRFQPKRYRFELKRRQAFVFFFQRMRTRPASLRRLLRVAPPDWQKYLSARAWFTIALRIPVLDRPAAYVRSSVDSPRAGTDLVAQVSFLSHTPKLLNLYTSFARQAAQAMTIRPSKTLYLDNKPAWSSYAYDRWTVNRSPFVHGKHQDQFEVRTHHRILELYDADRETVLRWMHYVSMNMPAGVGFQYQLHTYEPFSLDSNAEVGAGAEAATETEPAAPVPEKQQ